MALMISWPAARLKWGVVFLGFGRRRVLLTLLLLTGAGSFAKAATFGVPTQIATDGQVCTGVGTPAGCAGAAIDPPGYLILTGTDDVNAAGDTVHQMRLFIEVTGTTLDIRVFDAGRSGSRDQALNTNTTFTYTLFNPAGGLVKSIGIGADVAGITENRLARMSSAAADVAFVALNAGTAFTVTPGLYELRITASGGGSNHNDRNSFGVDIRDGTPAAAGHYNAYTFGLDDDFGQGTAPPAADTSLVIGALSFGGNGGTITQDMVFYPYVTRGCSLATSNFDMDSQAGASTSITDTLGTSTTLTVSGATVHSENTATIHTTGLAAGVQNDVNNYGLYSLQNNTGSQFNIIDWRIADFQGWADNPTIPRDPTDVLRMFLPNGYTGGVPPLTNATAPTEPILAVSYARVSGANPPAVGFTTRFVVQVELGNPGAAAIALNAANDQIVSGLPPGATNLGSIRCFKNSFSNTAGTAVNGGTFARCDFNGAGVTLNTGDSAFLTYEFDYTPAAAGTFFITNAPAAPAAGTYNDAALGPTSTTWGQYSRFPTGTVKAETLGPVCDLRAATGAAVTRASLTGLRVDPGGLVEFATLGQRRTASFNLYATHDRSGQGPRTLLNASPIAAPVPDAIGPSLYRAHTDPISAPYLMIEEIEATGRRRFLGPFAVGDQRMQDGLTRAEGQPAAAGASSPASRGRAEGPRLSAVPDIGPVRTGASFVKVEVAEPGPVRVSLADLRAMGLSARVPARHLHVTSQGGVVPFEIVAGDKGEAEAITFFNPGLSTAYTATNVFIVGWGARRPQLRVDLTRFDVPVPSGSVRVERNRYYAPGAPLGTDPWIWDYAVSGETWPRIDDPTAGDFDLPELDALPAATVPVRVRIATVSPGLHTVDAEINGVSVGSVTFAGQRGATLLGSIAASDLRTVDNTLRLSYSSEAVGGGLLYLGHVDIGAPRLDPPAVAPLRLAPYEPALVPPRGTQYLIVTHPDFRHQAAALAGLKASEGYSTAVVEVQQAYDAYSAGIIEARAIARLIADAARSRKLEYVLLVGDDSLDPLNNFGSSSASYVPSLYAWDDEFGRIPSEVLFADVDGDKSPDVAIGRLPVQTAAEAEALVAKIARQSQALSGLRGRQIFAVDNQAPGDPSFEALAAQALARLPGREVTWARIADGTDTARAALRQGLATGAQATHFFGHASFPMWADENLLSADEVPELAGSPETVVFAWACESQWFLWPFGSSLGEALVLLPHGGAVASFGPTGITNPDAQVELLIELYPRAFTKNITLGEAIRQAKAAALARDPGRLGVVVHGFNLLGDPSLRLRQ